MSVREAFVLEAPRLAPLPNNPFPLATPTAIAIGKTPYARFDRNDYSVPHTHVRRQLTILADTNEVRILDGAVQIAHHARSYDAGAQIEDPDHYVPRPKHADVPQAPRPSELRLLLSMGARPLDRPRTCA
jgi:hypothetical protein